MSAIKDGRYPITLDKERHLLFNLNALDEFQDKMGGYGEFEKVLSDAALLRWLLTLLINEGINEGEEPLTEAETDEMIRPENITEIRVSILNALVRGMIGDDEPESVEDEWDGEEERGVGAGKIDLARLLYIGMFVLKLPEREVWKTTAYKITALFKMHRSFSSEPSGQGFPRTDISSECEDDIDAALGGF